ncbi:tRNA(adenine(34)) deaminase, chloroplastic [Nicotiana sylvestris]|uniref:tRNA(adenine(34)) deaminase n=1 Tax=Nicotiana sylvestris TaxID=4096 RepID=A0A1U7XJY0_NICSY|nr:PREDICTED: tRNA(adenine(34)) deaminase, chloroplastic [Nicotiana sylvestris]
MYNVSSTLTLKCNKGSASFSSYDHSYCLTNRFSTHPLAYSSSLSSSSSCCSCCATNAIYRVPICPSSLYGLRQSTLIQCKKLILGGFDRYNSRFQDFDIDRECYYDKVCSFKENGVSRRGGKWGKGRYRCLVFEEMSEGGGVSEFDEAEVMLSLLTEDVDEALFGVRERNGWSSKMIEAEKRKNEGGSNYVVKKKGDKSGSVGSKLRYKYESEVIPSRKEEKRREENKREDERASFLRRESRGTNRKEEERASLLRESHRDRAREDERASVLMRESRGTNHKEEERASLLRESHRDRAREGRETLLRRESRGTRHKEEERASFLKESHSKRTREEERESLSRREDHWQRLRKDGSSCSSYYSASSTSELDNESEMQIEDERFEEEPSGKHGGELKSEGVARYDGVYGRDQKYTAKQGVVSRKDDSIVGLYGAAGDWRKKSEKRLTDMSIEETASRKESKEMHLRISQIHGSSSEQVSGSSKKYDGAKQESASLTKFEGQTSGQHGQAGQSNTNMKYKQFVDTSESYGLRSRTAYGTRTSVHETEETSNEALSQIQQAREEYSKKVESIIKEDEYRRRAHRLNQESDIQKNDIKRESAIERVSDTELRKKVSNEHHQSSQITELVELREGAEQLTKVDEKRTHVSHGKSETRMKNQEDYTNLVNKSSVESKEHSSQARIRDARSTKSVMESHEKKTVLGASSTSITHYSDTTSLEVTEANKREVKASSQVLSGRSSIMESKSGFPAQEVSDSGIKRGFSLQHEHIPDRPSQPQHKTHGESRRDEVLGLPLNFPSHEDALGSADRLQKSSTQYVGEFVEKVRHEISNSEILKETKTSETKLIYEGEQHSENFLGQHGSGDSQSNEHESRQSSLVSGAKGPSDEMWDVTEPSVREPPEIEVPEDADKEQKAIVKRSGRSLWNIIGDVVQLRWMSRSDRHSSTSKSGGRSSPNQSTSSETWFSGHEAEDNNNENAKNKRRLNQESASIDRHRQERLNQESASFRHRQEMVRSHSHEEASSSSSSREHMKGTRVETSASPIVSESILPSKTIALPSAEDTPWKNFEGTSGSIVPEGVLPLPSIQVRRSPIIEEITEAGQAVPSSSSEGQAVSETAAVFSEVSGSKVKDAEMRQRRFLRSDQFVKDKFDEWEEAFKLESEQRKIDEIFMKEALVEAKKAADNWEVPVGAVLVHDGKIVARGCNLVEELRDSTAHAEMLCIREASNTLRTWRLSDTTLYVTLEPCPMCAGAILQARVDTVVWGAPNKLLGADGSWIRLFPDGDEGSGSEPTEKPPAPVHPFHPKITIRRGVLASECADAMQQFFRLRRKKKEKKSDPPTPPSCLPISSHQPKFLSKIHDVFHIMFCL